MLLVLSTSHSTVAFCDQQGSTSRHIWQRMSIRCSLSFTGCACYMHRLWWPLSAGWVSTAWAPSLGTSCRSQHKLKIAIPRLEEGIACFTLMQAVGAMLVEAGLLECVINGPAWRLANPCSYHSLLLTWENFLSVAWFSLDQTKL